jgi:hypothetical protein
MGIADFFKKIGHEIKAAVEKIGHAFAGVFIKLFGLEKAKNFVDAAEALLQTEFGQILLDAGAAFIAVMKAGTPLVQIILGLMKLIVMEAEKAGIAVGEDLAHLLASLIVNKVKGNLDAVSKASGAP